MVPFFYVMHHVHWLNQRDIKPWKNGLNELSGKLDLVSVDICIIGMHCDNIISHIAVFHHHTSGFVIIKMFVVLKELSGGSIINF